MTLTAFVQSLWHGIGFAQCALIAFIWTMTLLGAACAFLRESYHGQPRTLRGFMRFALPPAIVGHPQARLDIAFMAVKKLTRFVWGGAVFGNVAVAYAVYRALCLLTPAGALAPRTGWSEEVLFILGTIVTQDFMNFLGHFILHKVSACWAFHKVHHSATVLTPMTNYRIHPLQEIWDNLFISLAGGTLIAVYSWRTGAPLADITLLGIQAYFLANCLSFYHLRHSHIHFRYPRWLERIFMSPAQHQIHHSCEPRYLGRNFGLLLSCWDQLFGTIAYADADPVTQLGLTEDQHLYRTVWGFYAMPFVGLGRKLVPSLASGTSAAIVSPSPALAAATGTAVEVVLRRSARSLFRARAAGRLSSERRVRPIRGSGRTGYRKRDLCRRA